MSTLTQNLSAKQYMLVKAVFLYKQILHLPYIHTEHILENEDKKTSFQGLLYEILNGFWTQLTAEDDQGMGKDQELFCF